jgi:hypothetical protein
MRRFIAVVAAWALLALIASAEPPGKPAFLQQSNNADVAYCLVVLKDTRYRKDPKDFNLTLRYLSTAAYMNIVLQERAGENWNAIYDDVVQWTAKAIEEDLANGGALRLSPEACLDLASAIQAEREPV